MKRIALLLAALLFSPALLAGVYKWVDDNGNIHYSDRPQGNPQQAKPMALEGTSVVPPIGKKSEVVDTKSTNQQKDDKEKASDDPSTGIEDPETKGPEDPETTIEKKPPETKYTRFSMSSPKSNKTIRSGAGKVSVRLSLSPKLDKEYKHQIYLYMDGKRMKQGRGKNYTLTNVDPGTHKLRAEIRDAKGKMKKRTAVVTFYMKRKN